MGKHMGRKIEERKRGMLGKSWWKRERSTNRNEETERQKCLKGLEKERQGYGKRRKQTDARI